MGTTGLAAHGGDTDDKERWTQNLQAATENRYAATENPLATIENSR